MPCRHRPVTIGHADVALQHEMWVILQAFGQFIVAGFPHPFTDPGEHAFAPIRQRTAIHIHLMVVVTNAVTRQANHALDPVFFRVLRRPEHHHIATRRLTIVQKLFVGDRPTQAVGKLVDQDEIANQQGGHHRTGWNPEGLGNEAAQAKHQCQHREKRFGVIHQNWIFGLTGLGCGHALFGEEQLI